MARNVVSFAVLCWCLLPEGVLAAESQPAAAAPGNTRKLLDGVRVERDLACLGPERQEKLDLYQAVARSHGRSPAVVIIHGGGWVGGASPVTHIRRDSPPTLTLHGERDTTVDRDQSKELDRALTAAGVESKLIMVPGANHTWPLKTAKFDCTGEVVAFFDRHLKPKP